MLGWAMQHGGLLAVVLLTQPYLYPEPYNQVEEHP
jgi:hypothetical protein